eukprot:4210984-Pyramimonas_sp.AAC.1
MESFLRKHRDEIKFAERGGVVKATGALRQQTGANLPWHLDRIDQTRRPLDQAYTYTEVSRRSNLPMQPPAGRHVHLRRGALTSPSEVTVRRTPTLPGCCVHPYCYRRCNEANRVPPLCTVHLVKRKHSWDFQLDKNL